MSDQQLPPPNGLLGRTVPELVLLILAIAVSLVLVFSGLGVLLFALLYPDLDQSTAINALSNAITTVAGGVLGYLAGRQGPLQTVFGVTRKK